MTGRKLIQTPTRHMSGHGLSRAATGSKSDRALVFVSELLVGAKATNLPCPIFAPSFGREDGRPQRRPRPGFIFRVRIAHPCYRRARTDRRPLSYLRP